LARKPADQTVQREDVLLAAADVFHQRGYQGATMADIAARLNLTAGSLYHHFPAGKRDLLLAVLNDGLDIVLVKVQDLLALEQSPTQTLRQMIQVHVTRITEHRSVGAAMVFEIHTALDLNEDAQGRDTFLQRRDEFERCYRHVIERGIAAKEFHQVDVPLFTKALLGALNWISVWYRPDGRLTGEQIADRMADLYLSSLRC
jgi:TetR/AcrR family transcriptional regulator, cholesterol catabolism regulator